MTLGTYRGVGVRGVYGAVPKGSCGGNGGDISQESWGTTHPAGNSYIILRTLTAKKENLKYSKEMNFLLKQYDSAPPLTHNNCKMK